MDPLVVADGWTLESIEQSMHRIVASGGAPLRVSKDFVGRLHQFCRDRLLPRVVRARGDLSDFIPRRASRRRGLSA